MPNQYAHSSLRPNNQPPGTAIANANITLRQLRAFLAVAEELSFSRAAGRLMVSTPWISETVKELERQLKVTLFVRTTRSVELTDAGRVFSGLLAHVLDDLDDAVRVAQRMAARSGRALSLGYVIGAGLEFMPRLVRTYLERRPDQPLNSVEFDFADPTAGLRPPGRRGHRAAAAGPGRDRHPRADHRAAGGLPARGAPAGEAGVGHGQRPAPGADHRRAALAGPVAGPLAAHRLPDRATADRGRGPYPRRRVAHGGPRGRHQRHVRGSEPLLRPPWCRLCPDL